MARHNALGRIRQIAIIHPAYVRRHGGDLKNNYEGIRKEYVKIEKQFNQYVSDRKLDILIFSNIKGGKCIDKGQSIKVTMGGTVFYGRDCVFPDGFDPRSWTQDIFTFRDASQIYVHQSQITIDHDLLFKKFKLLIPPLAVSVFPVKTAGGNLLIGRCVHQDYLLTILDLPIEKRKEKNDIEVLANLLLIDIERVIDVGLFGQNDRETILLREFFYHADLYLQRDQLLKTKPMIVFYMHRLKALPRN